jgi:hypothetical protein
MWEPRRLTTLWVSTECYADNFTCTFYFLFSMALQPLLGPGLSFSSVIIPYTDGRIPWTSDKPVARPLPIHRTTQTQNKRIHRHTCLEWDSNPLRPRDHRDRLLFTLLNLITCLFILLYRYASLSFHNQFRLSKQVSRLTPILAPDISQSDSISSELQMNQSVNKCRV